MKTVIFSITDVIDRQQHLPLPFPLCGVSAVYNAFSAILNCRGRRGNKNIEDKWEGGGNKTGRELPTCAAAWRGGC